MLDTGTLWLDGGAMFGVVPRTLWEKERRPDDRNRILLGMHVLLLEDGRRRVLVDAGAGVRWDAKERDRYRLEPRDPAACLADAGLRPDQIDVVVHTHLHFDHAGGSVGRAAGGGLEPAFPNARHVVQRGELAFARSGNERTRASYRPDDFEPLASAGMLQLLDGDADLGGGLALRVAPGHTPHMQVPVIATGEGKVAFLADLVPTTSHLPYPYVMGYDVEPLRTIESRKRILPEAARDGWILVFQHDVETPVATLRVAEGRLGAQPLGDLAAGEASARAAERKGSVDPGTLPREVFP